MELGTAFKLSLYGLTAIVGAILGAAEGEGAVLGTNRFELFLPYVSLPVALLGYLVTERKGIRQSTVGLSAGWANALGAAALAAAAGVTATEYAFDELLADMGARQSHRANPLAEMFSYPDAASFGRYLASAPQYSVN